MEKATFAGGCFWCTEAIFKKLKGVSSVLPGYSGGDEIEPTYEQVSSGNTRHAEAVQIEFESSKISYEKLIEVFFYTHNPTTPNQQNNDMGPQYRSIVFYHDENQKIIAEKYIAKLENNNTYSNDIVTVIEKFETFYVAEDYHKNYYEKNKDAPYCNAVIAPKLKKLLDKYGSDIKDE